MTLLQDQKVRQFSEKMNAEQKALMLTLMISRATVEDIAINIVRTMTERRYKLFCTALAQEEVKAIHGK